VSVEDRRIGCESHLAAWSRSRNRHGRNGVASDGTNTVPFQAAAQTEPRSNPMLWHTPVEPQRQMPLCGKATVSSFGRPVDLTSAEYHNWIGRT